MSSKLNVLALACAFALGASGVAAQASLQFSPVFSNQDYDITVSGGVAGSPFWVGIDTVPGTTVLKSGITLGLALSPSFIVLPTMSFEYGGTTVIPMSTPAVDITGLRFYSQSINIDPTSDRYLASNVESIVVHPRSAAGQEGEKTALSLSDDQVQSLTMRFMGLDYYGQFYSDLTIDSNGRILFQPGSSLSVETSQDWLDQAPAVAPFWDDLDPGSGGKIEVVEEHNGAWVQVRYTGVPQFGFSDSSSAAVTIYASGTVMMEFGSVSLQDAIVGITPGNSVSSAGSVDLSAQDSLSGLPGEALYERFDGTTSTFDLSGSVLTFLHLGSGQYATILD